MKIYFAALLIFLNVSLIAQSTDAISQLKHFVHNVRTFNHLYPQEKVFLHCDNTAYFQGDTIWFNAYVVSASSLSQVDLSKILYIELIAPEGEIITTQKLAIKSGQCYGQIALIREIEKRKISQKEKYAYYRQDPSTKNYYTPLPSGYYEVRAYTHAMLNWENDIIFSRVFPIFDTPEKEGDYTLPTMDNKGRRAENTRPKEKKQKKVNVTFYPEGGDIIKDLPSKVAFKVTDEQGKNISATGYVANKEKQIITNVTTLHEGMGSFCFTPQEKEYQLTLETENKIYTFPLPIVRQKGVALSADISKEDSLRIKLQRSKDIENDTLGISVICRGTPLYFKTIYGDCDKFQFTIPCDTLSEGVHQITVFDKKGEIHAERMVFIRSLHTNEWEETAAEFNKEEYKPFEQIEMKLKAPVKRTGRYPESCSVAIRDGNADILTNYSENLHTYLLLTSELRGTINKPEFYFESRDSIHRKALDLLMLTQGWRRYEWKQMAGVTPFNPTYHMEKGLTLTGKVLHPGKSKPIPDVSVSSCITQKVKPLQEGVIQTDSIGNFAFQFQKFEGKKQLTLSVTKGKQYIKSKILLNRSFSPPLKAFQFNDMEIVSKPITKEIPKQISLSETQLLSDVTIKTKRRQAETYTLYDIAKEREKALDNGKILSDNTVREYLYKRVNGFSEDGYTIGSLSVYYLYRMDNRWAKNPPIEHLINIPLEKVDRILVYDNRQAHKHINIINETSIPFEDRKTISIHSRSIFDKIEDTPGIRQTQIEGYSTIADYYHPQHTKEIIQGDVDYRRTLYWNSTVELDKNGKAIIQFYNYSECKLTIVNCETLYY